MEKNGFSTVIFAVLFLVSLTAFIFFFFRKEGASTFREIKDITSESTFSASPFPFEDLTIPYLRNREYKSSLGSLQEVNQNAQYSSYLTSYNSDGLKINGLLTIPVGEEPRDGWPTVVFVHGYISPKQYQTLSNYSSSVDYLAKNGLVVFKVDLRGHANSEGVPGGAYYSSDYVVDVLNARAALMSSDFVNPKSIGLWGHSMAGNVVFRSLAVMPEIPAVVIWAGAVYSYEDFSKFGINDDSYRPPQMDSERQRRRQQLFDTYGQFNKDSDFWKQVAATNYLDGIAGAVQIHHAVDDNVVNIGYSKNLMSILNSTSIDHELFEYPGGGHNLSGVSFNLAMQRTVDFFKKNLQKQ